MSFRRIPFQFSATDPAERQRELEKRFGVPAQNNMYVDTANPLIMGPSLNTTASPRLQHRVPLFVEGYDKPVKSSVDSNSATMENKPKVRVIPIEIEGEERPQSSRQRTYSGPAGIGNKQNETIPSEKDASPLKRSIQDLSKPSKVKTTSEPKVYNIPIKVEETSATVKNTPKSGKVKSPVKKHPLTINGCTATKHAKTSPKEEPEQEISEEQKLENNIKISLRKIDDILEELKSYEAEVKEFNGTNKDKQYRYLDEMLTRCMLKLDDIETMGNEQVRSARKNAVKLVQASVDLLERKVNGVNDQNETVVKSHVQDQETGDILVEKLEVEKVVSDCGKHFEGTNTDQPVILNEDIKSDIGQIENEKQELNLEVLKNENKTAVEGNNVEEVEMEELSVEGNLENQPEVEMSECTSTVLQSDSDEKILTCPQDEEMKEIQTTLDAKESKVDHDQLQKNSDIEMEEAAFDAAEIKSEKCIQQSDCSSASQSN